MLETVSARGKKYHILLIDCEQSSMADSIVVGQFSPAKRAIQWTKLDLELFCPARMAFWRRKRIAK